MAAASPLAPQSDRRVNQRWYVKKSIRVLADDKNAAIGTVTNLSDCGMRIVCEQPLTAGSQQLFWLEVYNAEDAVTLMPVHARVMWSGAEGSSGSHAAGLQFTARQEMLIKAIASLAHAEAEPGVS